VRNEDGHQAIQLKSHYDAIVVGSGHNGLIAAAYLARAGQSVLVLERNHELGGATRSQAIFPGRDARLSRYSYLISLLPPRIIADLGLHFTSRRRRIASCTPFEQGGLPGALLLSNTDEQRSQAAVQELAGEAEWRSYQALLELERTLAELVWPSLTEPLRSRKEWEGSLSTKAERQAWEALVERPLGEVLERYLQHDLLRGLVFTDAKIGLFTHPLDPSLLQNRCFILHTIGNGTGEWQVPVGGMGALVDQLAASASASGVTLLSGVAATAIHPSSPRHAVDLKYDEPGRVATVEATRVLVNAGPQVFAELLGAPVTERAEDEGSVAKVNMLLRRLPRLKAEGIDAQDAWSGTFHVNEGYQHMIRSYGEADTGQLPSRPPAEIYCHTLTDPSILSPDLEAAGYHTLTLFGLDIPYRLFDLENGPELEARRKTLLAGYFEELNQFLAEPIEECLAEDAEGNLCVEMKTPPDLERELALYRGNIFHAAPSWFFSDGEDPAGAAGAPEGVWGVSTAWDRIYRCGASARRGGGVSGIPGYSVARQIFQELRLPWPQD
jgi:phytoene dehydrogenase-like protein